MNNFEVETYEGPDGRVTRDGRFRELRQVGTPGVVKFSGTKATGQKRFVRYKSTNNGNTGQVQTRWSGISTWSVAYPRT